MHKNLPDYAGDMRSINPWSGTTPRASEQLSPCVTATEASAPQSLCSTVGEAAAIRNVLSAMKSRPRSPQPEKAEQSNEDPVQPKSNT